MEQYYAHRAEDGRLQTVGEHLKNTARLAEEFARPLGLELWARACGLAHDLGKYSRGFQRRLLEQGPKVDHTTAGAKELAKAGFSLFAYCAAGHHGGLPDGGSAGDPPETGTLWGRLKRKLEGELEDYRIGLEEVSLPSFAPPPLKPLGAGGFSAAFLLRMVFSCLVDADFQDTENFMRGETAPRSWHAAMGGY